MIRRVALTFLVLQGLASTVAWACTCTGVNLSDAPLLFVGEARHTAPGCGGGFNDHVTTFNVLDVCNGDIKDTVRVWHSTNGASCGLDFDPDVLHIVAASENEDGLIVTGLCSGSQFAQAADCAGNGL